MMPDLHQPHDRLFRKVFSEPAEAAGLLRAYVPSWLVDTLDWSGLTLMPASYVDDELRASESDLLFAVDWRPGAAEPGDLRRSLRLYLLFEHQSSPDRLMRFRLLKYCCGIWDDFLRSAEAKETPDLPPIVPLVFYQGESRWHHATEFSELFAEPVRRWPWTPQFKHLLVDQSQTDVGAVPGETLGRAAQLALMAAARHQVREALERTVQIMGELDRAGQGERFRAVVFYVLHTQDKETLREFFAALRREVPGPGGDMMTYAEELIREGRQEGELKGRQEGMLKGRQEGQVATIESFLRAGVGWPIIKQATGIDQDAFELLRRQTHASARKS